MVCYFIDIIRTRPRRNDLLPVSNIVARTRYCFEKTLHSNARLRLELK